MQQTCLNELARERQREILAEADQRRLARLSTPSDDAEDNLSMFGRRRDARLLNLRIVTIAVR
jgi:hypothetical protein